MISFKEDPKHPIHKHFYQLIPEWGTEEKNGTDFILKGDIPNSINRFPEFSKLRLQPSAARRSKIFAE
jgi:hypothetical protein